MTKRRRAIKWQARDSVDEIVLGEVVDAFKTRSGRAEPNDDDYADARDLVNQRKLYHVLVVHTGDLRGENLVRKLQIQNFTVAGVTSFNDAERLAKEADLLIVRREVDGELDKLKRIRKEQDYSTLPIYVFSDEEKPEINLVDWMPSSGLRELKERVLNQWQNWENTRIANALSNPVDSVLNDILVNCNRSSEGENLEQRIVEQFQVLRELAPFDERHARVALVFYRTQKAPDVSIPGVKAWSGISTDDVYTLEDFIPGADKYVFKFFISEERAKVEMAVLEELSRRAKETSVYFTSRLTPRILTPEVKSNEILRYDGKGPPEFYIMQQYLPGPMVYSLMPEVMRKAREGDDFAIMFRNAVAFLKNEKLAHLQINPVPIPAGVEPYDVDYGGVVSETLTENLEFFVTDLSEAAIKAFDVCVEVLYRGMDFKPTQYFDLQDLNVIYTCDGTKHTTLKEVQADMKNSLGSFFVSTRGIYSRIREIVDQRRGQIDFNKCHRRTSFVEDTAHEFFYHDWTPEEREILDIHFLLCRKKETYLAELKQSGGQRTDLRRELTNISKEIKRLEAVLLPKNNRDHQPTVDRLSKPEISDLKQKLTEYEEFKQFQPYIQFYRHARWFGHFLRKYIPMNCQTMDDNYLRMKELCGAQWSNLFGRRGGNNLEKELAKYLEKSEKADSRHLLCTTTFTEEHPSPKLNTILGENLPEFVDAANNYFCAHKNLAYDNDNVRHYIARLNEVIDTIIPRTKPSWEDSGGMFDGLAEPPSLDGGGEIKKYLSSMESGYEEDPKLGKYMAAKFIKSVLEKLFPERINYRRLQTAGVRE